MRRQTARNDFVLYLTREKNQWFRKTMSTTNTPNAVLFRRIFPYLGCFCFLGASAFQSFYSYTATDLTSSPGDEFSEFLGPKEKKLFFTLSNILLSISFAFFGLSAFHVKDGYILMGFSFTGCLIMAASAYFASQIPTK